MEKTWNRIQLFHNGDEFFTELIASIRRAQKSITVEFYIFEIDAMTEILLVELQLAALRGCEVQLLVDGVGSFLWLEDLAQRCQQEGIFFRVYHPLPGFLQWIARVPEALFSRTPNLFRRANRRNHRKTVVIDRKRAFLGSMNMTQVHFAKMVGAKAWRDTGVYVEGAAVESLVAAFELAWTFAKKRALLSVHSTFIRVRIQTILQWHDLLRLNANDKIRRYLYRDLCRRINHAKSRVYIATAYFLPKRAIVKALAGAARRGVDVRLLIPGPTDVPWVKWVAHHLPYKLQQQGVQIFEYQPSVLHAKYMVIDDWSTVGSFNLNHRSLLHDLEVEAVLTDTGSLNNLVAQFQKDLTHSKPLDMARYERRHFWERWFTGTLFKLRYWF